mgnify:CR=1 FL=1
MKTLSTLLVLLFFSCISNAQWTNDPANPQVVCNAANLQSRVTTLPDGNGGVYVFWLDGRNPGNRDVFGQHYDSAGNILWDANGREIVNYVPDIIAYKLITDTSDHTMIIATITHQTSFFDTTRIRKIDAQGAAIWSNDIVAGVSEGCSGSYIIYQENLDLAAEANAYTIKMGVIYCGGSNGNRIGHFTMNGTYNSLINGDPEGDQSYNGSPGILPTSDGSNDVNLFYSNGNGSGAHGSCLRLTSAGDTLWGPVDVLQGTNGLNYEYRAVSDASGIAFAFISVGSGGNRDVFLRKIDAAGNWAWSTSITTVCGAANDQDNFYLTQDNQFYYLCWDDARSVSCGNFYVYAQKVDKATGAVQWATDGVLVFNQCTYIPYPKMLPLPNGKIMVTDESTDATNSFIVTKLNSDGTNFWSNPVTISNGTYAPFYDDYNLIESGMNRIAVWSNNDNVYICRIQQPVLNLSDTAQACGQVTAYGQTFTTSGNYNIPLGEDTTVALNVTVDNIDTSVTQIGDTLIANQSGAQYEWINCSGNISTGITTQNFTTSDTGYFAVIIHHGNCTDTSDCFHLTADFDIPVSAEILIRTFPNPFNSYIQIENASGFLFQLSDLSGKIIFEKQILSNHETLPTELLSSGGYFCRFSSGQSFIEKMIMKIPE